MGHPLGSQGPGHQLLLLCTAIWDPLDISVGPKESFVFNISFLDKIVPWVVFAVGWKVWDTFILWFRTLEVDKIITWDVWTQPRKAGGQQPLTSWLIHADLVISLQFYHQQLHCHSAAPYTDAREYKNSVGTLQYFTPGHS